ncbi:MAG: pyruvate dehydrogenase (acetyl-transferring), homodimeric type, partial [Planctomycetes bacterium]|nr:pyruvate dehydrogenase (acetyl-transferring), homodimeric type [Planctomycetota bacterium]
LADKYGIAADVWSATSYNELRRDCLMVERWNMLHPGEPPRRSYLNEALRSETGPFIASSDYMKAVPDQIAKWVPGGLTTLGTDGFGRSESRAALRRHFEVDAEHIAIAAMHALARQGKLDDGAVRRAISDLGVDPETTDPMLA